MKIFLDYNIAQPLGFDSYVEIAANIADIPAGTDLVGLTFFHHNTKTIAPIIDQAMEKSRHVIVYFCEFSGWSVAEFEQQYHDKYSNLQIFANALPHYPSRLKHIGEWFMCLDNPYSKKPWGRYLLSQLTYHDERPFKFDCLLGRPTPVRDFIAEQYRRCDPQDFIFTYFKDNLRDGRWDEVDIERTMVRTGNVFWYRGFLIPVSSVIPVSIYNQSHYSIVAETMCPDNFNFYTEKIAKPILAQRLFVVFGGYRYLENLRKLGFQTFHGIIDESYDLISDEQHRWKAAWDQVLFLLSQDPAVIKSHCQSIVQHNQQLMLETDWAAPIRNHVAQIIGPM